MAFSDLPARHSPLDRPQRLGILPTLSFWDDLRRQRLMRPFFLLALLPLFPVFILLKMLQVVAALILFDAGAVAILAVLTIGGASAVGLVAVQARRVAHQLAPGTDDHPVLPSPQVREIV